MTTIAIVGAGPGLGAAVARRFGAEGFAVALVSRTQENVDRLARDLQDAGIRARGYTADVRDRDALAGALEAAEADLGPVEVLQYSPIPRREFLKPVLETSPGDLAEAAEFSILGLVVVVQQVLPSMTGRGRGTILLVNGGSAATPNPAVAGTSVAFAGESAYGEMLHTTLAVDGVHVAQLVVPGAIGGGDPQFAPEALAARIWRMHVEPGGFRRVVGDD
ncbi:SDR family NAD(P)-dependent oxidoreductase [Nesterenkonia halophila]|uniref:SDR family NAD(P)-dependent oxidoreductase n=1 Tax=Nesterenkonia halophila TaxID=302044 RepID=UPI001291FC96|nr:SDR family NAD(P)-dependent oxidoreductase [Nesterenkonia halophila]